MKPSLKPSSGPSQEEASLLWETYQYKHRHKRFFKTLFITAAVTIALAMVAIGTWVVVFL